MNIHVKSRSVIGPVVLIGLGTIFLLTNLGLLNWSIWATLWRLWPVLLIAIGLEMAVGRKSPWATWVIAGVMVVAVGAAIMYADISGLAGTALEGDQIHHPLDGATSAEVLIKTGVGRLTVSDSIMPNSLIDGTVSRQSGEQIHQTASTVGNMVRFELVSSGFAIRPGERVDSQWNLHLRPQVPIDLSVSTGVGTADIDLSKLLITRLKIQTGIGKTEITVPASGISQVEVGAGIGEVTIRIPTGVAARIQTQAGIGRIQVDPEFEGSTKRHETSDYATAVNRVDLTVKGGIGSIRVERVGNR